MASAGARSSTGARRVGPFYPSAPRERLDEGVGGRGGDDVGEDDRRDHDDDEADDDDQAPEVGAQSQDQALHGVSKEGRSAPAGMTPRWAGRQLSWPRRARASHRIRLRHRLLATLAAAAAAMG